MQSYLLRAVGVHRLPKYYNDDNAYFLNCGKHVMFSSCAFSLLLRCSIVLEMMRLFLHICGSPKPVGLSTSWVFKWHSPPFFHVQQRQFRCILGNKQKVKNISSNFITIRMWRFRGTCSFSFSISFIVSAIQKWRCFWGVGVLEGIIHGNFHNTCRRIKSNF